MLADDVDDDSNSKMANVVQEGGLRWVLGLLKAGGFSAISVKHPDTYIWGFKDVSTLNWLLGKAEIDGNGRGICVISALTSIVLH